MLKAYPGLKERLLKDALNPEAVKALLGGEKAEEIMKTSTANFY